MNLEEMQVISRILAELTTTGVFALVWWMERKERQLIRDILLEDWKRNSEKDYADRLATPAQNLHNSSQ